MEGTMPGFYFALWCEDKRSMQITRLRNLLSDCEDGGLSPFSDAFMDQWNAMVEAFNKYDVDFSKLSGMTVSQIDSWCRQDLLDRGVIEE